MCKDKHRTTVLQHTMTLMHDTLYFVDDILCIPITQYTIHCAFLYDDVIECTRGMCHLSGIITMPLYVWRGRLIHTLHISYDCSACINTLLMCVSICIHGNWQFTVATPNVQYVAIMMQ